MIPEEEIHTPDRCRFLIASKSQQRGNEKAISCSESGLTAMMVEEGDDWQPCGVNEGCLLGH